MSEKTNILNRMRDVTMALSVAGKYSQQLSRIQLQKFIYLADTISPLYYILPPQKAHLTYKHGPYDTAIQNAVDALAFRGIVKILDVNIGPNQKVTTQYALTDAGISWNDRLAESFNIRWKATTAVGERVNLFGWYRLVNLVYAEPTFVSTRPKGFGQELHPEDGLANSAALIMGLIDYALRQGYKKERINDDLIVDLYFRYLDEYDRIRRLPEDLQ
jgi:hypothetical protein